MFPGTGLCDPHLRSKGDTAYLYLTHDKSPENPRFVMEDWWVLSSLDLTNWTHEATITPDLGYLGEGFDSCWAVDVAHVGERSYLYFSEQNRAVGVLVGESPVGPWHDPLGCPLVDATHLPKGVAAPYDPGVFIEEDGTAYLIVGVWDFFLIRLNPDMVSFDGPPMKIEIIDPIGPYGWGKTDDKPYLFKRGGLYYLSWGCFYAVAEKLSGPYQCLGSFITEEATEPVLRYDHDDLTHDRHGSFFEWKRSWYFICNDMSETRSRRFRDCSVARVEFGSGGEIRPLQLEKGGIWHTL